MLDRGMRVHLCRHAEAYPGEPDELRELTNAGRLGAQHLGERLAELDEPPRVVVTSPLTRARQTAEIVARGSQFEGKLEFTEQLAPGGSMQKLVEQINAIHPAPGSVLLSGHEPYLSGFISLLCVGGPELPLKLKKGALCRLDVDRLSCGKCATLEWLLQPRLFSAKPGKEERAKE